MLQPRNSRTSERVVRVALLGICSVAILTIIWALFDLPGLLCGIAVLLVAIGFYQSKTRGDGMLLIMIGIILLVVVALMSDTIYAH